ncbi:MAG TPA: HPr family phosphocarrier protein [Gammaproteobacteria bacterium]|nr:HPr family phosphocarrier protein [Gammaproteobacteria bacterium]
MISEKVLIQNKLGLHARAASVFVKKATEFSSTITVRNLEKSSNGKSIMSMMLLEASCGTEIELQAEGDDEQLAIDALTELIAQRFGEEE